MDRSEEFVDVGMLNTVATDYQVTDRGEIDQPYIVKEIVVVEAGLSDSKPKIAKRPIFALIPPRTSLTALSLSFIVHGAE